MSKRIVVIGSGAAGMSAASEAKRTDKDAVVTVITEDSDIAYSPCAIPWVFEGKTSWSELVMHDAAFYAKERDIQVLTETSVTAVDGEKKMLTAGGKEIPYDALVIATGSTVFIPPIEGKDLPGVFGVKTVRDGKRLESALKDAQNVVIGGAGVIGLEMAVALRNAGKDVTVIEMMGQAIPRIADADMAAKVQERLESMGIRFVMKAPIQKVLGTDKVTGVTAAGVDYPADIVIFATGVRADLRIPKMLELDIGQLNAVVTAPNMQTYRRGRLVDGVYAAGDMVQCQSSVVSGPTMSQLGSTAVKQGRVAGRCAAGGTGVFGATASPWVSALGGIEIGGTGMSAGLASWYGIRPVSGKATGLTRARYYPGGTPITVKLLADPVSHRIIGAQIVAGEDVTGRINWLTEMINHGVTAEDFAVRAENAYCPPTNMVRDVVLAAADDLLRNIEG